MANLADQLERALRDLTIKMAAKEALHDAVLRSVQPLIQKAAELAPRNTGKLSQSITAKIFAHETGIIVRVGPSRPEGSHGILLEYGTVYMTARPFLAPAFAAAQPEVIDNLRIEMAHILYTE